MALFQTQHLWVAEAAEGVAELVLDGPDKVNHLDRGVLEEIEQALTKIENEPRFQLCVLRSKKGASFCHGVEAATWSQLATPDDWNSFCALGQQICNRLSKSRMPTVALLGGACLGGGLELALACDWRVALDTPHTLLGFTELDLGLLPAWGGIARLPRLVSLERSLQLLLGGKKLPARAALGWGLVDDIATDDNPAEILQRTQKRDPEQRPKRSWRQRVQEFSGWGRRLLVRGAERVLQRRLPDDMPAPWEMLALLRAAVSSGTGADDAASRAALLLLAETPASRNLVRLQVLREAHRVAAAEAPRPKTIGILGTTPLALHLAAQAAVKGRDVGLKVADELTLGMAVLQLVKTLEEDVKRGAISVDQYRENVNRIRPTVAWKNLGEANVVIDADSGGREAKRNLIKELERQVSHETVIAVMQPWLHVAELQNGMERPERLLGMHWPAPVGRAPLVEVLATSATNDAAVQAARGLASLLGRIPIVAQEASGGAVNRIWCAGIDESLRLLQEGIAAERAEQAMRRFGMVYSPLEYLDLMGVEEYTLVNRRLESASGQAGADDPIVTHLLERRWLGVKTGVGFYRHAHGKLTPHRALDRWLRRSFAERATPMSKADQKKLVQERLVGRMVNESFRCLDDGVMNTNGDVDLAMMLTGWAPHRGGPCRYAEQIGYGVLVALLEQLTQQGGERYEPAPGLRRLAQT